APGRRPHPSALCSCSPLASLAATEPHTPRASERHCPSGALALDRADSVSGATLCHAFELGSAAAAVAQSRAVRARAGLVCPLRGQQCRQPVGAAVLPCHRRTDASAFPAAAVVE